MASGDTCPHTATESHRPHFLARGCTAGPAIAWGRVADKSCWLRWVGWRELSRRALRREPGRPRGRTHPPGVGSPDGGGGTPGPAGPWEVITKTETSELSLGTHLKRPDKDAATTCPLPGVALRSAPPVQMFPSQKCPCSFQVACCRTRFPTG